MRKLTCKSLEKIKKFPRSVQTWHLKEETGVGKETLERLSFSNSYLIKDDEIKLKRHSSSRKREAIDDKILFVDIFKMMKLYRYWHLNK